MNSEITSHGRTMPGCGQPKPVSSLPGAIKDNKFFGSIDWWAFGLSTMLVLLGYLLTLAPDVTLEDSGELAVGSMYAGVPHPPGYPVWTIYTWIFTKLLPFSNIAWRVAVGSAVAGALACGLIALIVSRGGGFILRNDPFFGKIGRSRERVICLVAGVIAGLLMGFNGYMWSQSVIVEVYSLSVLSLMALLCLLMRWMYAPDQRKYLYWAFFLFGICLTNHMSLLVAAMGIQVAVLMAHRRLGRDFFFGNSVIYLLVIFSRSRDETSSLNHPAIAFLFHSIGVASVAACAWLVFKTDRLLSEWKTVLISGISFVMGVAFYLYMPLASMTNPPMNWGYPRTVEGFKHAIKRGQYESVNPVHIPTVLKSGLTVWKPESRSAVARFIGQLGLYGKGAVEEFSPVLILLAFVPIIFLRKLKDRERGWIIGLGAIWGCLSFLLLLLLNPNLDLPSQELHRVFFTASHVVIAIAIGLGMVLSIAALLLDYTKYRVPCLVACAVGTGVAIYYAATIVSGTFPESSLFAGIGRALLDGENFLKVSGAVLLCGFSAMSLALVLVRRDQPPFRGLCVVLLLFPVCSMVSHWEENEQRGHLFGYWFGHDMFTPPFNGSDGTPLYPAMARDAVLFGGTDPGRFNPTYMIFCESFTDPKDKPRDPGFDRRDVYLITQNALADPSYQNYIRAHYNHSAQSDPPFFRSAFDTSVLKIFEPLWSGLDSVFISLGDRIEKERQLGSSRFTPSDFTDLYALRGKLFQQTDAVSAFVFNQLSADTRRLLEQGDSDRLAKFLAEDFNRIIEGGAIYDTGRFTGVALSRYSEALVRENPKNHMVVRWNRLLLEDAYPEIARSKGGLYPNLEIYTPSPEDSEAAFAGYIREAERRMRSGQLKAGENVKVVNGRIQVSGSVAVMEINSSLSKLIFDRNPDHEFYLEESFPLEWMFPHLTPHGIILKINRYPLEILSEKTLATDHAFWRNYSARLIGDWVDYDTSIKEICEFAERLYLRRDYRGFEGDRKFIRDDNAQKSFSKLRSAIGGIYAWRLGYMGFECPREFRAEKDPEELKRITREAEFAYKQAFAFCPYSPEAIARFAQFLSNQQRDDEAILLAKTCLKFDPASEHVRNLLQQLERIREMRAQPSSERSSRIKLAFAEIDRLIEQGQGDSALPILDQLMANPSADAQVVIHALKALLRLRDMARVERALVRMTQLQPGNPEAWYDLAGIQVHLGKNEEAGESLRTALRLNDERLKREPSSRDLAKEARKDPRFSQMNQLNAKP